MKNLKLLVVIVAGLILVVTPLMAVACEEEAPLEPIVLKFGTGEPPTHPWSEAALVMMDKIEEETDGLVSFETYFAGSLVNPRECFAELAGGVADISALPIGLAPSGALEVERALMGAYYGVDDVDTIRSITEEVMSKYPELEADWAEYGKILAVAIILPFQLHLNDPITKIEDLAGMTIRAWPDVAPVFAELGAESIGMPSADVYVALQKGTLDGATAAWEQLVTYRWAEVTKYHVALDIATGGYGYVIIMNWDTWNSLSSDIQEVFEDNFDDWSEENDKWLWQTGDEGIAFAEEQGNTFIDLSPEELDKFYDLLDSNFRVIMADLDAKGYNATAIYEEIRRLVEE